MKKFSELIQRGWECKLAATSIKAWKPFPHIITIMWEGLHSPEIIVANFQCGITFLLDKCQSVMYLSTEDEKI